MQLSIYFETDYGKIVVMSISRNQRGEYSLRALSINDTFYTAKQIRTAKRESILINYASTYIDIGEQFSDAMAIRNN